MIEGNFQIRFAELPREAERIVAQVVREAAEECAAGACPIHAQLEDCAREAVASLWHGSRITGYVPLLALRRVRCCVRSGTCATAEW